MILNHRLLSRLSTHNDLVCIASKKGKRRDIRAKALQSQRSKKLSMKS